MIDIEKFICSLIKHYCEAYDIDRTSIKCWFDDALEEQGLEYKNGEIVKTQRRVAAEAKEAIFDNEDERIRRDIIRILKGELGYTSKEDADKYIAWLENQGKQKPSVIDFKANNWYVSKVDGKIYDMTYNPTDNIEPKFKVGDFIANDYCFGKVVELTDDAYLLDTGQGIPFSCEHNAHLWTIQDAKDGDVLDFDCGIGIFKNLSTSGYNAHCYCYYDRSGKLETNDCCLYDIYEAKPATKEQRVLLFSKMKEAGYEWDNKKKELRKIEQKPTWSEEDQCKINWLLHLITSNSDIDDSNTTECEQWLKSLKDRLGGK